MSKDVGSTIKFVSKVIYWLGIFLAVAGGILGALSLELLAGIFIGLIIFVVFGLISLFISGYGQMVENTDTMTDILKQQNKKSSVARSQTSKNKASGSAGTKTDENTSGSDKE